MSEENKKSTPATNPAQNKISPIEEVAVAEVSDAEIDKVAGGATNTGAAVHTLAQE